MLSIVDVLYRTSALLYRAAAHLERIDPRIEIVMEVYPNDYVRRFNLPPGVSIDSASLLKCDLQRLKYVSNVKVTKSYVEVTCDQDDWANSRRLSRWSKHVERLVVEAIERNTGKRLRVHRVNLQSTFADDSSTNSSVEPPSRRGGTVIVLPEPPRLEVSGADQVGLGAKVYPFPGSR